MHVFNQVQPLKEYLHKHRCKGQGIGFVPTMGALHDGHISLMQRSIVENDISVCSIYVNPTQFNDKADLEKYPRTLERDIEKLDKIGCNAVFCPEDSEIYIQKPNLSFNFHHLEGVMEGKHRKGHFNGVGIVVSKLLNIVNPDKAYFGQKDLQQFVIIKNLVEDLSFDVELVCAPIIRENDGLAMSSRNVRLNDMERKEAVKLYEALLLAKESLKQGKSVTETKNDISRLFLANDIVKLEYFEVVDANSLQEIETIVHNQKISLCIAAFVGNVRLIDNVFLFD
jgi:pantoate--beta-alanine ligase